MNRLVTMIDKIAHARSGCPDCRIEKRTGFNDVRIAGECLSRMKSEAERRTEIANREYPAGCRCTEMDSGGDCGWCHVYYDRDLGGVA